VLINNTSNEEIGQFRKIQTFMGPRVYVEGIPNYNPTAPENMETALVDFEKFANSDDQTDILVKVALIHYQFETIHPFASGNGRIGRISDTKCKGKCPSQSQRRIDFAILECWKIYFGAASNSEMG